MIFSKNSLSSEKRAAKVYRFFPAEAGRAVNFRKENKTLQKCAGISAIAALPEGVRAEKLYASGKTLFAWCDDKKIYSSEGGAFLALESVFAAAPAFCGAFDGSAAAPLFSDGEKTYVFLSGALYAANVPPFTAACYAYERLWIFGGGKLKFSAPLAYDDFSVRKDGGGEIEAPDGAGGVLALVPFENRILLFRERGVQILDVRGEPTDFCLRDAALFSEHILKDTIACGGGNVWFCTDAGTYRGKGESFSRLQAPEGISARGICGAYAEGCYQLSARFAAGETYLLRFKENTEVFRAEISDVCGYGNACVFLRDGQACEWSADGAPLVSVWESGTCDLGEARNKVLERVIVRGRGNFLLRVQGGRRSRIAPVRFKDGRAEIYAGLYGDIFRLILETDAADAALGEIDCLFALSRGGKL